jgi:AcrR family transcriptional regulator
MAARKKVKPGPRAVRQAKASTAQPTKSGITHDDIMQASARIDPDLRRRSELLWDDRLQPSRGPKPGLAPHDVVQAAIEIADEEGLGAVTMHAVAARLGFTTMALYRYFPSKEALYDAIVDAGMGLPPKPAEPRRNWRDEITSLAHAKRAMLCSRPWLAELPFVAAPHGPNWLSWLEAVIDVFSHTGLSAADQAQMLSVIDGYTRGASDTAISLARARARGVSEREWAAAVGADLGRAIGDPRFPNFAALLTSPPGQSRSMEESFDFGLQRVLDGIERYIKSNTT